MYVQNVEHLHMSSECIYVAEPEDKNITKSTHCESGLAISMMHTACPAHAARRQMKAH